MNWIKRMNQALRYIDGHLTERIDSRAIASQANTSSFHFQKMFHILADVTLSEYIRNRRLTLAAREILGGAGILDTAIKYGYETQASFSRAFKRLHGFAPGMVRDSGAVIKAYPPLSFQLSVRGKARWSMKSGRWASLPLRASFASFPRKTDRIFGIFPFFGQSWKTRA